MLLNAYDVWFDPDLAELIALESHAMTPALRQNLHAAGVAVRHTDAQSLGEAVRCAFPERFDAQGHTIVTDGAAVPVVTTIARSFGGGTRTRH